MQCKCGFSGDESMFVKGRNTCKGCLKARDAEYYLRNKEKIVQRNQSYEDVRKEYVWNYLSSHPCVDCGESDPVVLEFDHQRDKEINITHLLRGNFDRLVSEIDKCEVRCCNCHRRRTTQQLGWWRGQQKIAALTK